MAFLEFSSVFDPEKIIFPVSKMRKVIISSFIIFFTSIYFSLSLYFVSFNFLIIDSKFNILNYNYSLFNENIKYKINLQFKFAVQTILIISASGILSEF